MSSQIYPPIESVSYVSQTKYSTSLLELHKLEEAISQNWVEQSK